MKKDMTCRVFLGLMTIMIVSHRGYGEETNYGSFGVKSGRSALIHNKATYDFYEIFWMSDMLWQKEWDSDWIFETGLTVNAGFLEAKHEQGFVGSTGPVFLLRKKGSGFIWKLGARLTLLENYEFGPDQLGGAFAFTEELGVNYRFCRFFEAGCQYRHMSNAGIYKYNPGIDLIVMEMLFHF